MASRTALVTGGSGFIGLHVVNALLEAGWTVRATVRSLANEKKVRPLRALADQHPGRLRLFEADLLRPGSFAEPMRGCAAVFHVASPFLLPEKVRNPEAELIRPALEGTRNVLGCVDETESVRRVVLTSSVGAMYGDNADVVQRNGGTLREDCWNETSSPSHNAYQYSKTLAEKEAWKIAAAQSRWDMVVICPGFVLGPSLSPGSDSGSLAVVDQLLSGVMMVGAPELSWGLVDVRDLAAAHVRAAEVPEARGRYIVAEAKTTSLLEMAPSLKRAHARPWLLPSWKMPILLFRLIAPLSNMSQRWVTANWGIPFALDNSRAIKELGVKFRPMEEMLTDHYRSWAAQR